ncbi:MAG: NADP-dependent phosphogluconate dehydrogenase [Bacillota bacterium]|nr:NADP-dependent phosphogluconate dehydrogenase [Bacillota bacterium]
MQKKQIGIIGLSVMGSNLALNFESKGFSVAGYDLFKEKVEQMQKTAAGKIFCTGSLKEFTDSLESPRKILMMVKAGKPVDDTIEKLIPLLEQGDIVIDGGNSFFEDTIERCKKLEKHGIRFIGTGVSGGEEGALKGPSIMPGGTREAYELVEPMLKAAAAKVNGESCCTYIGPDGAGHYVKMVHNGIEYADMQLICEAYWLLSKAAGFSAPELHNTFTEWNKGELDSYLIGITSEIFTRVDESTGKPVIDIILDKAGQKGTGKWTAQNALDLGAAVPTIAEAVFVRYISAAKAERVEAAQFLKGPESSNLEGDRNEFAEDVRKALYAAKLCSYAQGFALMRSASLEYGWNLDYGKIASIFRGGCIIRARFLNRITEAFEINPGLSNLMMDPYFKNILIDYQSSWRKVVSCAVLKGIPVPALMSSLSYFDSYRSAGLPANLLQAQRDYFGAHTFERKDRDGIFHYDWLKG